MVLSYSRPILSYLVVITSYITHHALLSWTHSAISCRTRDVAFTMVAPNLQFAELDIKVGYEIFKDVSTLSHQLGRLLVGQYFLHVLVGTLKIREEQDKNFFRITRDLNQVDHIINLVEISVKHLATHFNTAIIESNVHGRRSLLCHNVDLIWPISCTNFIVTDWGIVLICRIST